MHFLLLYLDGIFQYYFGSHYIDIKQINEITKNTLSILNKKFDVDLHSPSEFEKVRSDLKTIIDKKMEQLLSQKY